MDFDIFDQLIQDVFAIQKDERVVLLYDVPHGIFADSDTWADRRKLVFDWLYFFKEMGLRQHFFVDVLSFPTVGMHNGEIPKSLFSDLKGYNVIIAMTEYSVTSSLYHFVRSHADDVRCASMPCVERRMMDGVFQSDYTLVKRYATGIKQVLDPAVSARVWFSSDDVLDIDLRNRKGYVDDGDCARPGCFINFPSGEGFIAPYEAVGDEKEKFGPSLTHGILPFEYDGNSVKLVIRENRISEIMAYGVVKKKLEKFFSDYPSRRNIAELGIGCNPNAEVTGNFIEDEKAGFHIAYGTSDHIGGRVTSDLHTDLVFAKGCPIEALTVTLFFPDGSTLDIIRDANLRYDILI